MTTIKPGTSTDYVLVYNYMIFMCIKLKTSLDWYAESFAEVSLLWKFKESITEWPPWMNHDVAQHSCRKLGGGGGGGQVGMARYDS